MGCNFTSRATGCMRRSKAQSSVMWSNFELNARANPKAIGLEIIISPLDAEEAVRHRMSWDKFAINEIVGVQNDQIRGPDQPCCGRAF